MAFQCFLSHKFVTLLMGNLYAGSEETVEYVGLVKRPKTPLITARKGPQNK
jgi:hypothetical protein